MIKSCRLSFVILISSVLSASAQSGVPINGTYYVGNGNGMYAHIADAVNAIGTSHSGTIFLTPGYTDVITSTLNIGHLYGPGIKVFMMPGSTILENITDGSAGIKIMEGSALECLGATASGSVNGQLSTCQVLAPSGANMSSMVTTGAMDMGRTQDMFGLQGITFEPHNATVTAVGDFEGIVTPSLVANNIFFGGPNVTYEWHIGFGTGGGNLFVNNELRGGSGVTGAMLYITGGEPGYKDVTGPNIVGGEISCRGSSAQSIIIDGDPTGTGTKGVIGVVFDHIWNQDCSGADHSSPYISINNANHVTFRDMDFSTSTTPIFSITESFPGATSLIVFDNVKVICQTLNCEGHKNWIVDTTATGRTHVLPPTTLNFQRYGYFAYVEHDIAGSWPPQSVTSVAPPTVSQSGTVGSVSYQDAGAGYAWRVQNQGATDLDFGVNGYSNSWIESHQADKPLGKTLYINTKYGGWTFFGGSVFAPNFALSNGDQVPAMPESSAVVNHAACILSSGPPIVLGHCASGIRSDGSCVCQ